MLFLHKIKTEFLKSCFIIIFFLLQISVVKPFAQNKTQNWLKKLRYNVAFGYVNPSLSSNQSLTISSFPSYPQEEIIFNQNQNANQNQTNTYMLEVGAMHQLKPKLALGLALKYNGGFNHLSELFFNEEKLIQSNDLSLITAGFFEQSTRINSVSLSVVSNIKWVNLKKNSVRISLETEVGVGVSFLSLTSKISNIFLNLEANNSNTSQSNTLDSGILHSGKDDFTNILWQISPGFLFEINQKSVFKIGFNYSYLGTITIFKRSDAKKNLFALTTIISGSENQNLTLATTNAKRRLFSNTIFIRFYF